MSLEEVAPRDWDAVVPADAYLSREYAETAALLDPGELVLLHDEGTVFPCIVREAEGARDVTGLYGFGGPVGDSPRFYEVYEDQAALEAHRAMPHYAVWRAAADALDGPAEPTRCQPVFPAEREYRGKP